MEIYHGQSIQYTRIVDDTLINVMLKWLHTYDT